MQRIKDSWVSLSIIFVCAALYWSSLPFTAQYLDSSEMVASSYRLFRIHPPGFPLYAWTVYAWTHLLTVSTVFWRAAFLTSVFALIALTLVLRLEKNWRFALVCVLPLAVSGIFWRYAVLPDVFMLLALFTAILSFVYLKFEPGPSKASIMILILAAGGLNHTMLVFLAPIVIDAYLDRGLSKKSVAALVIATMVFIGGYCTLIFFNNDHPYSWGNVRTPIDAFHHLMRQEVGGLKMASTDFQGASFGINLWFTICSLWRALPIAGLISLIPVVAYVGKTSAINRRYIALVLSVLLYVIVLCALNNVTDTPTLEKFMIFPMVVVLFISVVGWREIEKYYLQTNKSFRALGNVLAIVAMLTAGQSYADNRITNDFSWNTIAEDYGANQLRMTDSGRKSILMADGDTVCFTTRYAQLVLGIAPDTLIFCKGTMFMKTSIDRFRRMAPELRLENPGPDASNRVESFLKQNMGKFEIVATYPVAPAEFHVSLLGLGRRLSEGTGIDVDMISIGRMQLRSNAANLPASKELNILKLIYSNYAFPYLQDGIEHANDPREALKSFERAHDVVPYCIPAIAKICQIKSELKQSVADCKAAGDEVYENEYIYFKKQN